MAYRVAFSRRAEHTLQRLPNTIQQRIIKKIHWYAVIGDPLVFAKAIQGEDGTYRFRIGDYRVLFSLEEPETIRYPPDRSSSRGLPSVMIRVARLSLQFRPH